MTEQQDVLDPQRPRRRRIPVILLGILPAAIAATLLIAGPHYVDPVSAATDASGVGKVVSQRTQLTPGVIAPAAHVDLTAAVQHITVTLPKVKAPAAKAVVLKTPTKTSTVRYVKTVKVVKQIKVVHKSTHSYTQFCANPSNPVATSGSTGQALLVAVNKERAKLGIGAMSWSSYMASIATSWSQTMVKNDSKTVSLIDGLAHNPHRPGAENVAVVYSSGGYSAATAINKMHKNRVYSQGHCLNLMNPSYHSMGAGVAKSADGNTWYATEDFR